MDRRHGAAALAIFAASFLLFSFRASHAGLASGYVDPVAHYGAQDEATYSRIALETHARGNWLTPTFLDRIAYFKPPLLFWLDGLSISLFGASAFALRLPSVLAGAVVCALSFLWAARSRGLLAGVAVALLLAGDQYWITLASANMMDASLTCLMLGGLYVVFVDPALNKRRTIALVSLALGAALLLKSAAAVPAIAAALFYAAFSGAKRTRLATIVAGLAIVAVPWYGYALFSHFRWFWDEHVRTELLGHNVAGTAFGSPWGNLSFYAGRLVKVDPVLAAAALAALVIPKRERNPQARPILLWLLITVVTMIAFGYHAATYLLPVITATAVLIGLAVPQRWMAPAIVLIAAADAGWLAMRGQIVWTGTNLPMTTALVSYCDLHRANDLFLIETDDEFFSAAQPLPGMHYGLIAQGRAAVKLAIDFQRLGIVVTADQFNDQARYWPVFRQRLDAMKLPAALDPRATEVLFPDADAIRPFIRQHAEIDFLLPVRFDDSGPGHISEPAGRGYRLLFATEPAGDGTLHRPQSWACSI